ncbi:MAG: hypothetical protein P4M15_10830, partial [Alphaproteobacteria bacterium]|nr:hypothetical protein [Alphaproteobacteria bacterium]
MDGKNVTHDAADFVLKAVEVIHAANCSDGELCSGCVHTQNAWKFAKLLEPVAYDYGQRQRFFMSFFREGSEILENGRSTLFKILKRRRFDESDKNALLFATLELAGIDFFGLLACRIVELAGYVSGLLADKISSLPYPFITAGSALTLAWLAWPLVRRIASGAFTAILLTIVCATLVAVVIGLIWQGAVFLGLVAMPFVVVWK